MEKKEPGEPWSLEITICRKREPSRTLLSFTIPGEDAKIQEAVQITSPEEFEEYIEDFQILGLGGTDFRPVFRYVDDLVDRGELDNLKGMIYFTDGFGAFPERPPAYETAFVFIRNGYWNPKVPPWAIKLVLERDEVLE